MFYALDKAGDVCFLYVYQATGSEDARYVLKLLSPTGDGVSSTTSQLPLTMDGVEYVASVSASPWQILSSGPFGVPLPEQWTAQDLLLWGGAGGVGLCMFAVGACCLIVTRVGRRDRQLVERLLKQVKHNAQVANHKKAPTNNTGQ